MFRNVQIGVDGGPTGRDAIRLASELADPDARLTLIHVHGGEIASGGRQSRAFGAAGPEGAQRLLEAERDAAEVSAELIHTCASSVGHGLHVLAERHAADLIVVGSHTPRVVGRANMDDDTRATLNGAPCGIAIAPHGHRAHSGGFATVGVGYDYSGESRAALAAARAVADRYASTIAVLYVATLPKGAATTPGDWAVILDEGRKYAQGKLDALDGVDATAVYGLPSDELAALSGRVDLLAVGSRNHGPVRRLLLGSTSSSLARHARCALLVLPRPATADAHFPGEHGPGAAAPIGTPS